MHFCDMRFYFSLARSHSIRYEHPIMYNNVRECKRPKSNRIRSRLCPCGWKKLQPPLWFIAAHEPLRMHLWMHVHVCMRVDEWVCVCMFFSVEHGLGMASTYTSAHTHAEMQIIIMPDGSGKCIHLRICMFIRMHKLHTHYRMQREKKKWFRCSRMLNTSKFCTMKVDDGEIYRQNSIWIANSWKIHQFLILRTYLDWWKTSKWECSCNISAGSDADTHLYIHIHHFRHFQYRFFSFTASYCVAKLFLYCYCSYTLNPKHDIFFFTFYALLN